MTSIIISITVFMIVIVVHELAHGYVAYLLGDNTAKDAGRLTFNPIRHADPMGTIILPIMLILVHSPVIFGWAKPVPINPYNFKNVRKGVFLTSIAGPASNMVLALFFAVLFKTGLFAPQSIIWNFLLMGVLISLVLGIFNLIPIPPLDGANILASILPPALASKYMRMQKYGFLILIALLYLGLLNKLILPVVMTITKMLLG